MSATCKAWLDLVALLLIWGGTLAITQIGVPALIGPTLLGGDGARLEGCDGAILTGRPDPDAVKARRRYRRWAVPGVIAITIGMILQAFGPISVLFPHIRVVNRNHRRLGSQSSGGRAHAHCTGSERPNPRSLQVGA